MMKYMKFWLYAFVLTGLSVAHAGSYEDWFRAIRQDNPRPLQQLLQRGFDPNTLSPDGMHGLYIALQEGLPRAAQAIAESPKNNVEWRNKADETTLMIAALKGHTEIVRTLIARGAEVNKTGWTPLHYAATGGHLAIMKMLIEEHAYIDAESPNKTTPLMMAAHYGTAEAVKLLLQEGADPTLRNELGLSAVDFAQRANRADAAELIAGAIRASNTKGKW